MSREQLRSFLEESEGSAVDLTPEEMARYVDGTMDPNERLEFEAFLASSPEARQDLADFQLQLVLEKSESLARQSAPQPPPTSIPLRPPVISFKWLLAAVALAALASAATYVLTRPNPTPVPPVSDEDLLKNLDRVRGERDAEKKRADDLNGQVKKLGQISEDLKQKNEQLTGDLIEVSKKIEELRSDATPKGEPRRSPKPGNRAPVPTPALEILPDIKGPIYDLSRQLSVPAEVKGVGGGEEDLTIVATSGWNTRVRPKGVVLSWNDAAPSWKFTMQRKSGVSLVGLPPVIDGQSFTIPTTTSLSPETVYVWSISDATNSKRFRSFAFRTISKKEEAKLDRALKKARTDDERVDLLLRFGMYDEASALVDKSETIQPAVKDYLRGQIAGLRELVGKLVKAKKPTP